jgi:hypothetical protein
MISFWIPFKRVLAGIVILIATTSERLDAAQRDRIHHFAGGANDKDIAQDFISLDEILTSVSGSEFRMVAKSNKNDSS